MCAKGSPEDLPFFLSGGRLAATQVNVSELGALVC